MKWRPTPSRNLPLVRLAFWACVAAAIAFLVLILWGLARNEPSHWWEGSDMGD
jgi:hypothetical protein